MKILMPISFLFLIQHVFGNPSSSSITENGITESCNDSNCNHNCPRDSIWAENDQCVCSIDKCNESAITCEFGYKNELVRKGTDKPGECCDLYQCTLIKGTEDCANVTCSEIVEECPPDSYRLPAHKSPDECCSIPQVCQCLPKQCEHADCAPGLMEKLVQRGTNQPGQCCPLYSCVKPVVTEEIALEPLPGGCITDEGKIMNNGESWMQDPCTSCSCNNGDKACHAFMCQVSCEMPLYVPSECCPVCNTTSENILAPECPPLTNCTTHCMQGFKQDAAGCIACQCKQEECKLDCPNGYAEAAQGKKLCKCAEITRECATVINCPKNCTIKNDKVTGCDICNCVVCESLSNCEKECDEGYLTNDKGCPICQCKTLQNNETLANIPESFCNRDDGSVRPNGESWIEGCQKCICTNGTEKCTTIPCAPTDCPNPIINPDNTCCPVCPETSVLLKSCSLPDGKIIEHNEKYKLDTCIDCICNNGKLACNDIQCPQVVCEHPIPPTEDNCCPTCPENQPVSVNTPRRRKCNTEDDGLSWTEGDCITCSCVYGSVICTSKICTPLKDCIETVTVPGTCCPVCADEKRCVFENSSYNSGEEWMANTCTRCKCKSGLAECTQKDCRQACIDPGISTDKICCPSCPENMKGVKMMHEVFYLLLLAALICVSGILSIFVLKQCRIRKQQKIRLRDCPCPVQKYHQYKYISTSPFETLNNSQKIASPEKASLVTV